METDSEHAAAVKYPPPILPIVTIVAGHLPAVFCRFFLIRHCQPRSVTGLAV